MKENFQVNQYLTLPSWCEVFRKKSRLFNLLVNKSVLKRMLNIAFPSNYLTVSINYFVVFKFRC